MKPEISEIAKRLRCQDNRCTAEPMFCVQKKVRDIGYIPDYCEDTVWINMQSGDFEETEPHAKGSEEFGYKERWETVMVAFTEEGCKDYLRQNGHNLGETRIYVESFRRCDEMIAVREMLLAE